MVKKVHFEKPAPPSEPPKQDEFVQVESSGGWLSKFFSPIIRFFKKLAGHFQQKTDAKTPKSKSVIDYKIPEALQRDHHLDKKLYAQGMLAPIKLTQHPASFQNCKKQAAGYTEKPLLQHKLTLFLLAYPTISHNLKSDDKTRAREHLKNCVTLLNRNPDLFELRDYFKPVIELLFEATKE